VSHHDSVTGSRRQPRRVRPAAGLLAVLAALGASACASASGAPQAQPAPGGPVVATPLHPEPTPGPATAGAGEPASGAPTAAPSSTASATAPPSSTPAPTPTRELPRGGTTIFPGYRLVGYSGAPGAPSLGRLDDDLDRRADQIERVAAQYAGRRDVLPVFELITVVVQADPGADGKYRRRMSDEVVQRYLDAARAARGLLLLNIQPGRSDFVTEVQRYERFLRQPDVGVALDPEWAVGPRQVPGRVYGQTTGRELDRVASWLSLLVEQEHLPEKVMVFHQVAPSVVRGERQLRDHDGVVVVKSVDGIGSRDLKEGTYRRLTRDLAPHVHAGFKLFYEEDTEGSWALMTPAQVLALRPQPEYVLYE
jgi:hypothetical protein